jgi:hypothetical protein
MTSNFAPRKSWKQLMDRNIAPRKWAWLALRTSNMQIPACGKCRNGGYAEYIGRRQNSSPGHLPAGEGHVGEVAAGVVTAVGTRRI